MSDCQQKTTSLDEPLTWFEQGILDRTLGRPADAALLDEEEEADYMRGYLS